MIKLLKSIKMSFCRSLYQTAIAKAQYFIAFMLWLKWYGKSQSIKLRWWQNLVLSEPCLVWRAAWSSWLSCCILMYLAKYLRSNQSAQSSLQKICARFLPQSDDSSLGIRSLTKLYLIEPFPATFCQLNEALLAQLIIISISADLLSFSSSNSPHWPLERCPMLTSDT